MIGNPFKRAATWVLLTIGRQMWGLSAALMPLIVEVLGPFGALRWIVANMPKYEKGIKEMGPVAANLVYSLASLLNGCAYCLYANGRAFELLYFKHYGKPFPLDEQQLVSLIRLDDDAVRSNLTVALTEAGLIDEIALFHRLYELKLEGAVPIASDNYLMHAIKMYDVFNFCAISGRAALDDAHDRVNKDVALKVRYAEARLDAEKKKRAQETMPEVDAAT